MHITVEPRDGFSVLHLRGEFDTYYCSLLQKEIDGLLAAGVKRVALNLRLVKFINSTALGAVIKAAKTLTAHGGKLAISRPSSFCRDIMDKVGLDRIVPIYDTDEDAGTGLLADVRPVSSAGGMHADDDESSLLFSPVDGKRVQHFISASKRTTAGKNPVHGHDFGANWSGVGRMAALGGEGLRFTWNGGSTSLTPFEMGQLLAIGTALRVKFRVPLLQKGLLEAEVTVTEVEERPDGVKIGTSFSRLDDETRRAVHQYAEDLAYLKRELRPPAAD